MEYKEVKCPVCERFLKSEDDIVVCPKCGAPYHRACYFEKGSCIFIDLHEKNEAWKPAFTEPPQAPDTASEPKDKICPRCGRINAHSALFCDICSFSLSGSPQEHQNSAYNREMPPNPYRDNDPYSQAPFGGSPYQQNPYGQNPYGQQQGPYQPPFNGAPMGGMPMTFGIDPLGGYQKDELIDENVTAEEMAAVVKQNTPYYMNVLRFSRLYGRRKFNFSACLLSGAWLLYRKDYKKGALFTILFLLFTLAETYLSLAWISPMLFEAFGAMGIDITQGYNYMQMFEVVQHLMVEEPNFMLLSMVYSFASIGRLVVMVVCGFNGNRWYLDHCIKTVKKVKAEPVTNGNVLEALSEKGGINTPIAICLIVCYLLITYLPAFLL